MGEVIAIVGLMIAVATISVVLFKTYKMFDEGAKA